MPDWITYRYWLIGSIMAGSELHWEAAIDEAERVCDPVLWVDDRTRHTWEEWDKICGPVDRTET